MKRKFTLFAAALTLCTVSLESQAQEGWLFEGTQLIVPGGEAHFDHDEAVEYFLLYRHKDYQGTTAPKYVITDKKARAMFTVGGFVNFRTAYDFPSVMPNLDFIPAQIPMSSTLSNQGGHIFMDASTSRIFMESVINTGWGDPLRLYIESDFRGIDNSLHLRQAYIKYFGFKAGVATSTFTDINSAFHTIDFEGPNAFTYRRNIQLQYSYEWQNGLSMAAALELPTVAATYGTYTTQVYQQVPDVPVYIQYKWGKERHSHIRLSAVMRNMFYGDLTKNETEDKIGWGAQLSGSFAIGDHIRLYGQLLTGEGMAPYVQDLQGMAYDLVDAPGYAGTMTTLPVTSWFAGMEYKLTEKMPLTVGYSQVLVTNEKSALPSNSYKMGQYLVANCFYNLCSAVNVGVEYLYGTRYDFNNNFGRSQRIQAAVQFNF